MIDLNGFESVIYVVE